MWYSARNVAAVVAAVAADDDDDNIGGAVSEGHRRRVYTYQSASELSFVNTFRYSY